MSNLAHIIAGEVSRLEIEIFRANTERTALLRLLRQINGEAAADPPPPAPAAPAPFVPEPVADPVPRKITLVRIIRQIVADAGRAGVHVDAIAEAVQKARPETTRGTVAASLSGLKKRGEMRRTRDGLWRME